MEQSTNPFYPKKTKCPYCDTQFSTLKVRLSYSRADHVDSDMCPYYLEPNKNPYFYFVHVCPECGFAFTDQFSSHFSVEAKEAIRQSIQANWHKRDFCKERDFNLAVDSYKLALLSAELKKEKKLSMAGLSLRLAWLYRSANDPAQEIRFLQLAEEQYEAAYLNNESDSTSMSEMMVLYLVGELNRRLGNLQKAVSYFAKVIEHPHRELEVKTVKLAREQWQLAREEYAKANQK